MAIVKTGEEAQEQAKAWDVKDVCDVSYTSESTHIGCRWVWRGNFGDCLTCGDAGVDFDD